MGLFKRSEQSASRIGKSFAVALLVAAGLVPQICAQELFGRIFVVVLAPDKEYQSRPFTASAICDGRIIFQQDGALNAPPNKASVGLDKLPLGMCDVRVESEGLITETKKGIQVFERDRNVEIAMRPGEGVRTVELAEGGLAREEVAARLRALESAMEKVKSQLDTLSQRPPQ